MHETNVRAGRIMRKLTVELVVSAVIVSLIEIYFLILSGILQLYSYVSLLMTTVVLAVLEIFLVFLVEELILHTKTHVKRHIKRIKRKIKNRKRKASM